MQFMPATPSHLVDWLGQVAARDQDAFAKLYSATSLKLFGIVLRILKNRELAEDVLQDVYFTIWEKAGDFDGNRASAITWMATIARNRALDELRRRKLPHVEGGDEIDQVAAPGPTASDKIELDEDLKRLEDCLSGLDEARQAAIRLAYLDGLSRQDLAERLGLPLGTVKTWLHRSLKQLKDCLGS